ncbi:hypothetical protein GIB67_003674 [Kingdonia uniflora]|uniref:Glycosyl hydrolase family 32 C-terminal domain-containing protein n=1 Tax=Kingdonia uniflora TaxID=39325 RepID=A0A7J7M3V5_9MAGN|nr:hypothetical protein GIB67_003674 [Kingdonia uniflora]
MRVCPDFFPASIISKLGLDTSVISSSIKHELKVSLDDTKREYYTIGIYYHVKDKYIPHSGSMDNNSGRRYDYGKFYASKACFDSDKNREKEASKRGSVGPFGLFVLASKGLEEETVVIFRNFKDPKSNSYVALMCSDHSRSSLVEQDLDKTTNGPFLNVNPAHDKLSLRTLIDHSIVECFGEEGKACITSRVYPKLAIGDRA